jgi:L-rhamnose-H+ transport protein
MTLGMSFAFIGLSLAYALNYGAQIACGFTIPMLLFESDQFLTSHGYVILGGVAVCLVGVIFCGRAGILKERSLQTTAPEDLPDKEAKGKDDGQPAMSLGLIIAFVSGILCACYAVASAYAGPIGTEASGAGNPAWAAAWAVTAMILWGGAVTSCLYCIVKLTQNGTWGHLAAPGVGRVLALAAAMAVLHDAAIFFFGLGWISLGKLGVSAGYPVFMSFAIIVGNIHGFRTGEWKGASRESIVWIVAGIAILVAGVCLIAQGKAMGG